MATIEKRNLAEKEVVLQSKLGPEVEEIVDGEAKMVAGPGIPIVTVTMRELTCSEVMDADDWALAQSQTGAPSAGRMWKTYGIWSVVKIKDPRSPQGESVSPKSSETDYEMFLDRISSAHVNQLGGQYRLWATELALAHDPKNSPTDKP